jgi:hypothetical protein
MKLNLAAGLPFKSAVLFATLLYTSLCLGAVPPDATELTGVEKNYLSFYRISRSVSTRPESERARTISNAYEKIFKSKQMPAAIRSLSDRDVNALFKASSDISFYTATQENVHDMRLDLDELEARHIASDEQLQSYYLALYQSRQFDELSKFYSLHKDRLPKPITFIDSKILPYRHSVLVINTSRDSVSRDVIRLRNGIFIVVVGLPSCQYTQHAVKDIDSNEDLRQLLESNTSWLAPADQTIDIELFQKWNQTHPRKAMVIAYRASDWPEINDWATPTFYVYRNGVVVAKVSGWPRQGRAEELKRAILGAKNDNDVSH